MKCEIGQRDGNNQYFYFQLISISIFVIVRFFNVIFSYHTLGDKVKR